MYTQIEMQDLENVRETVRLALNAVYPNQYFLRTFFVGPRPQKSSSRPASTQRQHARHAKIAIYKIEGWHPADKYSKRSRVYGHRVAYL